MQNNVILNDDAKQTLTFSNIKDETYNISLNNNNLKELTINVINSKLSIIENLISCLNDCQILINIDSKSQLHLFTILVDNKNELAINRIVNNDGVYESMQIDLTNNNVSSNETINLLKDEAKCSVIGGIYAINKAAKKYQTNLNHYAINSVSKAQLFAINDDNAHVSIYTDAYIKNGAHGAKANQEGRIINLSNTCSGIVLPNLHIDENDVEASHSCSVGSLNQDHMYYLESRGLNKLQSRNILIKGYFNPILENISDETIKEEISKVLQQRIG